MKWPKQKPALPESEARVIADEYVTAELGFLPTCDRSTYEGNPGASWSFIYRIPTEAGAVMTDPSHWVVVVDVQTKAARFFPLM